MILLPCAVIGQYRVTGRVIDLISKKPVADASVFLSNASAGAKTNDAPAGWCIAQTDHYASKGFTQHFFCVNVQTKEQIDPLKFPAVIEPLTFAIQSYRPFTNVVLKSGAQVQPTNADTKPTSNTATDRAAARKNKRLLGQK